MSIDTGKVKDRRRLRFNTLDEVLADAERVAAADKAGALRRTGNWTTGQTLGHLASWMGYAYDGYPENLRNPPWFIKLLLKVQRNRFMNGALPAGVKIPKIEGGTAGTEVISTEEGIIRLRASCQRLKAGPPSGPNPVFGPMTHDDWIKLACRHAELHLSFLHP